MHLTPSRTILPLLLLIVSIPARTQTKASASVWLTDPAQSILFEKQKEWLSFGPAGKTVFADSNRIVINEKESYQSVDGFGFALTGGSAQHIIRMSAPARKALLEDLFATTASHIGTSYLRVSIGASDLNERVFSYDDMPAGQTDSALQHFDLGPDKQDVIPVLKEILAINPAIKILGSPWSPPVWMKDNHDTRGGSLLPQYYQVYARYFVRYIQAMQENGIRIDAITVQNEPLHPGNNPSCFMRAPEMALFVKSALGPAFKKASLPTKIIVWDHNADKPEYPLSILADPEANMYVDGSAFHLYGGKIENLSKVHEAYPGKNLYFTEQWVGAPGNLKKDLHEHVEKLIIGATRNWCRNVIEWNLAADPNYKPHTDRGGCDRCLGAVTIAGDSIHRNPAYYIIAHAAKFVRPGSRRIASTSGNTLPNVTFRTPTGQTVLIVLNAGDADRTFQINYRQKNAVATLSAGAVATYVW
ncbi:MAG: glucosylceramidase [Bacteroidetes bacterium]|nr:glucosylceramidase [Bacteroidota bacterium]